MSEHHFNPLFIGHGSPMNAVSSNSYTRFLHDFALTFPIPRAILVISAHWQTRGTWITGNANPGQIYDFYGFPDELYRVRYAPPGSPETAKLLEDADIGIQFDGERGIDHAGWAVVKHLYPEKNVPLLEMSLDVDKTEREHFDLGQKLARFCDQGILIIGSGNLIHNLRMVDFEDDAKPFQWAVETDAWQKEKLETDGINDLIDYRKNMPHWQKAIPTDEHYLPLLYVLGMRGGGDTVETVHEEIQNGSISMRSLRIRRN
jgi:4,5-DOPA dioxygenase extradiol